MVLFVLTVVTFLMSARGVRHENTNVFFRAVYGSILLKMFACILAAFVYIALAGKNLNKPALFICMGLYMLYTGIEVAALMKMLRSKNG